MFRVQLQSFEDEQKRWRDEYKVPLVVYKNQCNNTHNPPQSLAHLLAPWQVDEHSDGRTAQEIKTTTYTYHHRTRLHHDKESDE